MHHSTSSMSVAVTRGLPRKFLLYIISEADFYCPSEGRHMDIIHHHSAHFSFTSQNHVTKVYTCTTTPFLEQDIFRHWNKKKTKNASLCFAVLCIVWWKGDQCVCIVANFNAEYKLERQRRHGENSVNWIFICECDGNLGCKIKKPFSLSFSFCHVSFSNWTVDVVWQKYIASDTLLELERWHSNFHHHLCSAFVTISVL